MKALLMKSIVVSNLVLLASSKKHTTTKYRTHKSKTNARVLNNFATATQGFICDATEFYIFHSLNFVLKAVIQNPLTTPSILWTILFVCTRSCKMDEIHLLYRQGFTFTIHDCLETQGIRKLVSILNLAWPLKSLDFGAFEPFGLIGKLGSPTIIGTKDGFCSGQITPSERYWSRARAIPSVFGPLNQPKGGVTKD